MNDLELLEMAAKAANIKICHTWLSDEGKAWSSIWVKDSVTGADTTTLWNPLGSDGCALRLAVKLGISMNHEAHGIQGGVFRPIDIYLKIEFSQKGKTESDRPELTRRLFVMVAAEIGKSMP